jgi:hypothetical protein
MQLIAATMRAYGRMLPTASADEFCDTHPQLMTRHVLRLFYSPRRRMEPRAKTKFMEPDLASLPRIKAVAKRNLRRNARRGITRGR